MNGNEENSSFEELEATTLFCPQCRRAVPVIKHLMLVLPDGEKYSYHCRLCGTQVGSKTVSKNNRPVLIL